MNKIKNIIDARRLEFRGLSFEEKLLVINSVCLFLPFFLVGIPFVITVICCLVRKETRRNIFRVSHAPSFIAFGIVGLFAAIANKNLPGIGGGIFILFLIVFSFLSRAYMTRRLFCIITDNICYLSVASFFIGMVDYFVRYSPDSEHRTSSTFFNPNYYAFIIEFVILICLYKLTKYPYKWRTYLFIAFLNCCGILFCKTRTAILAIFVGAVFFLFFTKQYKAVAACIGLVLIIVIGILTNPEDFLIRYDTFFWSVNDRLSIWATAFKGLSYRPIFGQGLWAYLKIYALKGGQYALNAHCIWLDVFLSFGIVGISFVAYYFSSTLLSLKKQVHVNAFYHEYSLVIALFMCTLAHCTTDLAITGVETSIIAMLLFGIVGDGKKLMMN